MSDPATIYAKAEKAALAAVAANTHLENPRAFDCGFAWVVVKPARGPFVNWCRKNGKGSKKDYGGGGWSFWMPGRGNFGGQSVAVFEAGARAFADSLKADGIEAYADSRLD